VKKEHSPAAGAWRKRSGRDRKESRTCVKVENYEGPCAAEKTKQKKGHLTKSSTEKEEGGNHNQCAKNKRERNRTS